MIEVLNIKEWIEINELNNFSSIGRQFVFLSKTSVNRLADNQIFHIGSHVMFQGPNIFSSSLLSSNIVEFGTMGTHVGMEDGSITEINSLLLLKS